MVYGICIISIKSKQAHLLIFINFALFYRGILQPPHNTLSNNSFFSEVHYPHIKQRWMKREVRSTRERLAIPIDIHAYPSHRL